MQPKFEGDDLVKAIELAKKWVKRAQGQFSAFVFAKESGIENVQLRDQLLDELVAQRIIERDEQRNGWYHRIDTDVQPVNWMDAEVQTFPVWLPLGLNDKAYIFPGNIIVLAGESNGGKSTFVLNVAYRNLKAQGGAHDRVLLFNSETHPSEFKGRAFSMDSRRESWTGLDFIPRSRDFHLVIDPNRLNIIDFLENLDDFWKVGKKIEAIHNRLQDGVAIICLQKRQGEALARGGDFTLEKARLAMSLFYDGFANYLRITKCKFPVSYPNPQGQEIDFIIGTGASLEVLEGCDWQWVTKQQREARLKVRENAARLAHIGVNNRGYCDD